MRKNTDTSSGHANGLTISKKWQIEMRNNMAYEECTVVGRNAVLEAYRSGKTIDKLFILDRSIT